MKGRIVFGEGGKPDRYYLDGKQVSRRVFKRHFPDRAEGVGLAAVKSNRAWPIVSEALGVHPKQVAEAVADAQKKGVPTEFTPDGRPVLRDRAHRKAYLRAYGFHDNQGGYGD